MLVFGIPANYDKKEMYELLHLHEKQVKLQWITKGKNNEVEVL